MPNVISHSLTFAFKLKAKGVNYNARDHLTSACVGRMDLRALVLLACWLAWVVNADLEQYECATQTPINEMPL
jgi:hypothetical protein